MLGLSWATPLYILGLYGLVRFTIKGDESSKSGVNWTPWESAGVTIFIYFFSQLVAGLALYLVPSALGWKEARITDWLTNDAVGQFLLVVLVEAITIGLLRLFLNRRGASFKTIGLKGKPELRDAAYAVMGYGVYLLIYLIAITVAKQLIPSLNLDQKQDIGFNHVSNLQLPLVFISLVVLPPLVEEIVMRGFLYTGLKQKLPRVGAMLITSGLFAIAHLQAGSNAPLLWIAAVDTFVLSMVLITLKEKTGNRLWSPIMLHALKNLIAFATLFIFHLS